MENLSQELEFLDFSGLSEYDKRCLQDVLSITCAAASPPCGEERRLPCSQQDLVVEVLQNEVRQVCGDAESVPGTVTYAPPPLPMVYPQSVGVATTLPHYHPVLNYSVPMLSGTHILGPGLSFYVDSNMMAGNVQTSFAAHHQVPGQHPYSGRRRGGLQKYTPRKDIPGVVDGFPNPVMYPPGPFMRSCFPGGMVQDVTGAPIVMHQHHLPAAMAPRAVHVPVTAPVYSVVAPAPVLPVEIPDVPPQEEVAPPEPIPVAEPQPEQQPEPVTEQLEEPPEPVQEEPCKPPSSVSELEPEKAPVQPTPKTWSSLFKGDTVAQPAEKPTAHVEPFSPVGTDKAVCPSPLRAPAPNDDVQRLAHHLLNYEPVLTPLALLPRGLTNKSNWCYVNATLQALAACPPFVHLIKSLEPLLPARLGSNAPSTTPVIDSVVDFISQFEVVGYRSLKDSSACKKDELHFGASFEPSSIYRMLSKFRSETFKVEGRQEDAEEFLSCLLNGLHDEMVDVMRVLDEPAAAAPSEVRTGSAADDGDWQVIGPKNRGCITRTMTYRKTPIYVLFLGLMRSALFQSGAQSTATLQPFFSLQLEIQSDKINSVSDALDCWVSKESLSGFVCSKTGQEVEASRQTTLEELPAVLILHLKCFVYDKSGGCQKLLKKISFSSDLELSRDLLAPNLKGKVKDRQRRYKLFAVVYHDGKEAGKGHYVTEVHHAGTGTWLRFDDSFVRAVADSQLFKYSLPRMPYLLLYRRADTISPAVNNSRSSAAAASSSSSAAYLNTSAHHSAGGRGLEKS